MSDEVFAELREEYPGEPLTRESADPNPVVQFGRWFDDAVRADIRLANGMTLATVGPDGQPSARIVLLKGYDDQGFVFYTNYDSRKGRELAESPLAALLFWWMPLQRQVRIEGRVHKVTPATSDEYFRSRPRASNMSAMASPQSQTVPDRQWLERRVATLETEWDGRDLVRPDNWGGYRLVPRRFEFWQGRADRLHDRLGYYRHHDRSWTIERFAP
ncbi:MAG: pyridoxamine 5'-phosphate oxidase [Proteobacteria bacterium]|nr:pyridoxamine 5'-phosphate oxidase [Pseudomonadota bacterium]